MALLQTPNIHDDLFHESSECTIQRWPAHLAKDMADTIHRNVAETLRQSRLMPRMDGIQLVQRHDIVNVERILGSGAFSQVSSVYTRDGRRYACKHLKQSLMGHLEEFRTAAVELVYEAHMLASFDHPNILKIRGWARNGVKSFEEGSNDSFFLLLDVLDETLDMRIERWQQERQEGLWSMVVENASTVAHKFENRYLENLRVMSELASALDYIHQRGVIFRDAKPQNIGFLGDRVQIFDFGLSRELPMLDTSASFEMSGKVGTLRYMAPEVATNQAYGISADVYSWAMVSYEMLALEKPFDGWTREMHANIVCMQGRRPDTIGCSQPIPMEMQIILDHAWNANPAARPTLAQCLTQLEFLKEQQLRKVQEQQFQLEVSRQMETELQYSHLSTANPSQLPMIHVDMNYVDMNYYLAAPAPRKHTHRNCLDDSIETIETTTLSIESDDRF
jgi:serine/threonine protein kinase